MKKLLLIATLIAVSFGVFAQSLSSYMIANKYKVKETNQTWDTAWIETTGNVYIYFDMGFGFASIINKNFERFILNGLNDPIQYEDKSVVVINALDDNGIVCELHTSFYKNSEVTLTVVYSDLQYTYLMGEEHDGYPDEIFGTPTIEDGNGNKLGKKIDTYNL
jgi:hypothetical protein